MNEMLWLRQMFQGDGFLATAMLVGLFTIVIFRRETIALPGLFRVGVILFALSIVIPPLMMPLAMFMNGGASPRSMGMAGGARDSIFMVLLLNGAGPGMQALSILCVFNAIMPRVFKKPEPEIPRKHPLDD